LNTLNGCIYNPPNDHSTPFIRSFQGGTPDGIQAQCLAAKATRRVVNDDAASSWGRYLRTHHEPTRPWNSSRIPGKESLGAVLGEARIQPVGAELELGLCCSRFLLSSPDQAGPDRIRTGSSDRGGEPTFASRRGSETPAQGLATFLDRLSGPSIDSLPESRVEGPRITPQSPENGP